MSNVDLILTPGLFPTKRIHTFVLAGISITDILRHVGLYGNDVKVIINGNTVQPEFWDFMKPKAGAHVLVDYLPAGGGDDGKNILRLVATIAVIALAGIAGANIALKLGLAKGGLGQTLITAGLAAIGQMAVNALIPPPSLNQQAFAIDSIAKDVFSISRTGNTADRYGVVPQVLGKHRMFPPYAAVPYTEISGNDQYLRLLFTFGHGPLAITDLKIGDTDIAKFDDVEVEIREGASGDADLTLYTNDIETLNLQVKMSEFDDDIRTSATGADEIILDFTFPSGLVFFGANGTLFDRQVDIDVAFRKVGDIPFTTEPTISVFRNSRSAVRISHRIVVPTNDQYDIRVIRSTPETGRTDFIDAVFWTALRTVRYTDPIEGVDNLSKVAMRIKATEQLNGVVDAFNAIIQTKTKDWNGVDTWVPNTPTSNPASLFRHILEGDANPSPVAEARLDLTTLQEWHVDNADAGREYNAIIGDAGTVFQRLNDVASVARATFNMIDGLFTVTRDVTQSVPVQVFTPLNSKDFRGTRLFNNQPHALRVRFVNELNDYQEDERVVFADGFTIETATNYETLLMPGVTDPAQAWAAGKYFLKVNEDRQEIYSFTTDIEHVLCTRGDLVRVQHDVPSFAVGAGRVQRVEISGGFVEFITLGQGSSVEIGITYTIQARLRDGTVVSHTIAAITVTEVATRFELDTPTTDDIQVGDLCIIGVSGSDEIDLIVTSIEPRGDLGAVITLTPEASDVHLAGILPAPAFTSNLTSLSSFNALSIQAPIVEQVRADSFSQFGGVTQPTILISLGEFRPKEFDNNPYVYQVQIKNAETDGLTENWTFRPPTPIPTREVRIDGVENNNNYDLRIRIVNLDSQRASKWIEILNFKVDVDSLVPADVVYFRIENTWLHWVYAAADELATIAGFRIRFALGNTIESKDWDSGFKTNPAHENLLKGTSFDASQWLAHDEPVTFLIKAVDTNGQESSNPAMVIAGFGELIDKSFQLGTSVDFGDLNFPGSHFTMSQVGDELHADTYKTGLDADTFWYSFTDAFIQFWDVMDDADGFWTTTVFNQIFYQLEHIIPPPEARAIGRVRLTLDIDTLGCPCLQQITPIDPGLFWTPPLANIFNAADTNPRFAPGNTAAALFWQQAGEGSNPDPDDNEFWDRTKGRANGTTSTLSAIVKWRGALQNITREKFIFTIFGEFSKTQGKIISLIAKFDCKLFEERIEDFVLSEDGDRLPITLTYSGIKQVGDIAIQGPSSAQVVQVLDKRIDGPFVQAFNKNGQGVIATIDATVRGF